MKLTSADIPLLIILFFYRHSRRLKYSFILLFFLNSLTLPAQIVINEIGIAPGQGNSGGGSEFIELLNKGGCTQGIDISCYVLMYSSTNLAGLATGYTITIPSHTILAPCSYYLIGGCGKNSSVSGWSTVSTGGNPWLNIYGTNGRNPDLDISTSSNSVLQGLHPGEIIDFNGQFNLYDASGQLVFSVSYNSGNNSLSENLLHIEITDDGVGREQAANYKSKSATQQKSFGLKMTSERIRIINQLYNINADVKIKDLKDSMNNSTGTKVIIQIPI
jgi:hypothetical protein